MKKQSKMRMGLLLLIGLIIAAVPLLVACAPEAAAPVEKSRRMSVQGYWDLYGEVPQGVYFMSGPEDLDWWSPTVTEPYVLGCSIPHVKDEYWTAAAYGIYMAAKELGITIHFRASQGYQDMEGQIRDVDDLVVKGVDAIVIGAVDSVGMTPVLTEVLSKNVFVTSCVIKTEEKRVPVSCSSGQRQGFALGEAYGKTYPGDKVILFNGPSGAEWASALEEGMLAGLEASGSNCEVLASKYHDMDLPKIMALTEDMLTAFPDVEGFLTSTDYTAKGAIAALRSAGKKPGEIKTFGGPISFEALQLMKEGWMNIGLMYYPPLHGKMAVYLAVHQLEGNPIPTRVETPMRIVYPEQISEVESILEGLEYAPPGWTPPAIFE